MKEGREPKFAEKTPHDELQKILHIKARKFSPNRVSSPHSIIGGRFGKQMWVSPTWQFGLFASLIIAFLTNWML